jgi:phosphomevalonate kinase
MELVRLGVLSEHDDGASGVGDAVLTSRSNEHANELSVPTAAYYEKICSPRFVDEHWRRMALNDLPVDYYVWMGLSQRGDERLQ